MTEEWKESEIREAIRKRYRQVSGFAHGCFKYPTGREGAVNLGYDPAIIESAPGKVGERGRVDGIDMTPEMVAAALFAPSARAPVASYKQKKVITVPRDCTS